MLISLVLVGRDLFYSNDSKSVCLLEYLIKDIRSLFWQNGTMNISKNVRSDFKEDSMTQAMSFSLITLRHWLAYAQMTKASLTGVKSLAWPNGPVYPQILFQLAQKQQWKDIHYLPQHAFNKWQWSMMVGRAAGGTPALWRPFCSAQLHHSPSNISAISHFFKACPYFQSEIVKDCSHFIFAGVHYFCAHMDTLWCV